MSEVPRPLSEPVAKGVPDSKVASPTSTFASLPTVARWADAINKEIRTLGEASLRGPVQSVLTWSESVFGETGPFAIIKRKAMRYRLPRSIKTDLLDRLVSGNASATRALTTLIVVAHPDDESIGAGARLRQLGDTYVVDVTDGAPRNPECARRHGFNTSEEYAEARRRELHTAMAIAGLPLERLIALDFADGEVTLRLAELCLRLTELIDSLRPNVVLTHPYEGGHTDHDATAFAVHLACGVLQRERVTPPAILEFTSYHARDGEKVVQQFLPHEHADRDQRVVKLSAAESDLKRKIFDAFTTQREVLEQFSTEFERFRPAPRYVFTEPPHAGQLNYERYGHLDRGMFWREQAERVLRALRMRRD